MSDFLDEDLVVAAVLDANTIVISGGANHNLIAGQRIAIFRLGEEIKHPQTGRPLGRIEVVKGYGKIANVQPEMSLVVSDGRQISGQDAFVAEINIAALPNAFADIPGFQVHSLKVRVGDFVKFV